MNTNTTTLNTAPDTALNAVASAWSFESSNAMSPAALQLTPPSIHAMGSTYVPSTIGAGFGMDAAVPGAPVRDAKQAAPPRGFLH